MRCAWKELLAILPPGVKGEAEKYQDTLQEIRLRIGHPWELVTQSGSRWGTGCTLEQDLKFTVNTASRYSPWAAATVAQGYITAAGGHRIGMCGEVIRENGEVKGMRNITSLNIRVARDLNGVSDGVDIRGNVLILGPPGCGKTTLLRDLSRRMSERSTVTVVDERGELFPPGFLRGKRMDILTGCGKKEGISMAVRTMSPDWIAVDEITMEADCAALENALWCGVRMMATAHAADRRDLLHSRIYRALAESGMFQELIVLRRDKTWYRERMDAGC